ncbi:MAG: hypothetical protein GTO63_26720 [Anaerolineae bacterium]|nr:hypothetical protein [Anaerolineae bacterium]NIN98326.1 hypothetical protein [Anaerolineae bacterium]
MNHKRLLPQTVGLTLVALLLAACGAPTPAPTPTQTPTSIPPPPTATSTPMPTPTPTPRPEHGAVLRVRAFHEAINAIEPGEETEDGKTDVSKGLNVLGDILGEHTTQSAGLPGLNFLMLAMASGMIEYSNMEYELTSESAECAVVKATGDMSIGDGTETLDEEYVVVEQGGKWLINLNAKSCR